MESKTKKWGEIKWGDVEEADKDEKVDLKGRIQESSSSSSSSTSTKSGTEPIRTIVEYYINEKQQRVKVTKTVKLVKKLTKVNKNVIERRKWKKFGDCEGLPSGPEANVTYKSTEIINMNLRPKKLGEDEHTENENKDNVPTVNCRLCGETGHWTLKCPKRSSIKPTNLDTEGYNEEKSSMNSSSNMSGGSGSSSNGAGGKYIPVWKRPGGGGQASSSSSSGEDQSTLRVTNLSEDTTEQDLSDLFRRFGHTSRIYLAKDRLTNKSRGFAFINYTHREDAQAAIDKLNGHGYDHLILQVEWAKPREEKPREGGPNASSQLREERGGSGGGGQERSRPAPFRPRDRLEKRSL